MMLSLRNKILFVIFYLNVRYVPTKNINVFSLSDSYKLLIEIVEILQWNNVLIFHDDVDQCSPFVSDFFNYCDTKGIQTTTFHITNNSNTKLFDYLMDIHHQHFPDIHVLYISCMSITSFLNTMTTVNDFDFISNRWTDFRSKSQWILVTLKNLETSLENILTDLCHVSLINLDRNISYHQLKTLTKTKHGSLFQRVDSLRLHDIFPNVKYNFNGRKMLIGRASFQLYYKNIINNETVYSGPMMNILSLISRFLNFTTEFWEPPDGDWGIKMPNNSYTGLLGKVERREVDILFAEYIVNNERSKVMDFIYPALVTTSLGIIYKEPEEEHDSSWLSIFKPFSPKVYILLALSFLIFSTLYIILETIPFFSKDNHRDLEVDGFSVSYDLFAIFGCLVAEGSLRPRTRCGKILVTSWWMFCVIFAATYSANLTSSLLLQPSERVFNNLQELSDLEDWKYGFEGDSGIQTIFENSSDNLLQKIWSNVLAFNRTDPSVLTQSHHIHIDKVMHSKYAFIRTSASNTVRLRNDCTLSFIENIVSAQQISFGVPLNSTLKSYLNSFMSTVFENGLLNDELFVDNRPVACKHHITANKRLAQPISFQNILGVFVVLASGIVLSSIEIMVEYIYFKLLYNSNKEGNTMFPVQK